MREAVHDFVTLPRSGYRPMPLSQEWPCKFGAIHAWWPSMVEELIGPEFPVDPAATSLSVLINTESSMVSSSAHPYDASRTYS